MAVADNAYSRLVAWLKILLPLTALAVLSTLFLFSRTIDPTRAIPMAPVDVEELAREPRINAPDYSGMTEDGAALTLTAASAKPDPENSGHVTATMPTAVIETPDGVRTTISSATAEIDTTAGAVILDGAVTLETSRGYVVKTSRITAAIDRTRIETAGEITGTAPMGRITAGQMVIEVANAAKHTYVLVFKNGVKLIYDPKG